MSKELEQRVEQLEDLEKLTRTRMTRVMEQLDETHDRLENLETETETKQLRREVEQLRSRTDMVQQVEQASALKPDQRAAVLIQTLYNDAHANESNGLQPKAKLTNKQARSALGGGMTRSKAWQAMQRAVELVTKAANQEHLAEEKRLLQYVKVPRSESQNSHLLLDLRNGEMPPVGTSFDITTPGGAAMGD